MNTVLDGLIGLDYFLVDRALRRLRHCGSRTDRQAELGRIERSDGKDIRDLTEQAFTEEWNRRKEAAHG